MADLRDVHGRGMNKTYDGYKMPADEDEMERLAYQHGVWRILMRGLYPPEVAPLVKTALSNGTPSVLDVGSGSGIWTTAIAAEFPNAAALGVDFIKPKMKYIPVNCRFEQLDVSRKDQSEHLLGRFDIVHCRTLLGHMSDDAAKKFVDTVSKFIKPGGLLITLDVNGEMYKSRGVSYAPAKSGTEIETDLNQSWLMRWMQAFGLNNSSNGDHRTRADTLGELLRETDGIRCLDEVSYYVPINFSSSDTKDEEELSYLMGQDMLHVIGATKPTLLSAGISPEDVEKWAELSLNEVRNPDFPLFAKFGGAWATKL